MRRTAITSLNLVDIDFDRPILSTMEKGGSVQPYPISRQGLERCHRFLAGKNSQAAKRAGQAIECQFALLETEPGVVGRPFDDLPEFRELIIPFGDTGYVALYHHKINVGLVYVLVFRYQKAAGY